jgi:hypothetical protein
MGSVQLDWVRRLECLSFNNLMVSPDNSIINLIDFEMANGDGSGGLTTKTTPF